MTEKRMYDREVFKGATIIITDNKRIMNDCVIHDVSMKGLRAGNIPSKFIPKPHEFNTTVFSAIVTHRNVVVKIKLIPRWFQSEANNIFSYLGFEVVGNEKQWFDFVRAKSNLAVQRKADVWGLNGQKYANR